MSTAIPFREGDIVTVRGTVRFDFDPGDTDVHIKIGFRDIVVPMADVTIVQRTFHIGETVAAIGTNIPIGIIRGICDDAIWVKHSDGAMGTYYAHGLQLVIPEAPPEPATPLPELRSDGTEDDQGEVS